LSLHPARTLERLGLARAAGLARSLRWEFEARAPTLRPDRAARLTAHRLREPIGRRAYRVLSEPELRATRLSDTAFVFGSGKSLLEIGAAEWERIAECDVVGFSHFHRQRWTRVDYHLVAEVSDVEATAASIRGNPAYADTIFLVMTGWIADAGNQLVGRRLLTPGSRIFRWRRVGRGRMLPPSRSFAGGLVHGTNSSLDTVNFALLMGWRRIVIAGVDLYDKEYFFLPPGVARPEERGGLTAASRFVQADHVVEMMRLWRERAEADGVELMVQNPRSLLAQVLPVYEA
jgi:hypothetical protein